MKIITDQNGKQFKMGRIRPSAPHICSSFKEMMKSGVLPNVVVPEATNYSPVAQDALHQMYGNDVLGDCVIAGMGHVRGVTSFNSGQPIIFTNEQIIQDYSAVSGYNPNAPLVNGQNPTDQGCDENTALNYWKQTGMPDGTKLVAAVSVDATNLKEYRLAMYLFENLYFGVQLPDQWINPFPSAKGFRWDKAGPPDPNNGHCFVACDLVGKGVKICSWGMTGWLTDEAIQYYAAPAQGGQLFTLLTPDIVSRVSQKSPAGYDIGSLTNYIAQL